MSPKYPSYLLDSGAISLYYAGDKKVKPYIEEVFSGRSRGFVSEVNLAEFYYKTALRLGMQTAETWYVQTRRSSISVVAPDEQITRECARLKVKHYAKLSLADCYAIASARHRGATILTTDSKIHEVNEVKTLYLPIS